MQPAGPHGMCLPHDNEKKPLPFQAGRVGGGGVLAETLTGADLLGVEIRVRMVAY